MWVPVSLDPKYFLKDLSSDPCNNPDLVVVWFPFTPVLWLLFNPRATATCKSPTGMN